MAKHYTIKDVAKRAGVSPSTVSLALNNSDKVRKKTKEKVFRAAKELEYIPNNFAVTLRQKGGELFGVLVPDLTNPFYIEIVSRIKQLCEKNGFRLQVMETLYDLDVEEKSVIFLKSVRTTGYIFIGTYRDKEIISSIRDAKVVFIDKLDGSKRYPFILIDNKKAMYDMTRLVISKGCREIYYITQSTLTEVLTERKEGFIQSMEEIGLRGESYIIKPTGGSLQKLQYGYKETMELLKKTRVDAIITSSDLLAIGSISAISELGLKVPEDILVTGFDNIDYTNYSNPRITTVNQPRREMAEIAFSYLTGELSYKKGERVILEYKIIERDSTKR